MNAPFQYGTLAMAKKIRIFVCIDEFQQLANLPEYKNMEGKMRITSELTSRLQNYKTITT